MALSPEERAARRKEYSRRYYETHKAEILAKSAAYQKSDPERTRGYQRAWAKRNAERERLRARAKNWKNLPQPTRPMPEVCECCGKPCHRALSLDHCHDTDRFRGWLCANCNLAIGKLGDTIEAVEKALAYLKRAYQ